MKHIKHLILTAICVLGLSWLLAPSALAWSWPDDVYVSDFMPFPTLPISPSGKGSYILFYNQNDQKVHLYAAELRDNVSSIYTVGSTYRTFEELSNASSIRIEGYQNYAQLRRYIFDGSSWGAYTHVGTQITISGKVLSCRAVNPYEVSGNSIPLLRIDFSETVTEVTNETIAEAVINELGSFFPYYLWNGDLSSGGNIILARDMRLNTVNGTSYTVSGTNMLSLNYTITQTANGYTIGFLSNWLKPEYTAVGISAQLFTNASSLDVEGFISTGLIKPWMEYEDAFIAFAGAGETVSLQDILLAIERQTTQLKKAIDDGNNALAAAIQNQTLVLVEYFTKLQKAINDGDNMLAALIQAQTNTLIEYFEKLQKAIIDSKNELVAEIQKQTQELIEYFNELYGSNQAQTHQEKLDNINEQLGEMEQKEQQIIEGAETAFNDISPMLDLSFSAGDAALFVLAIVKTNELLVRVFENLGEWKFIVYLPLIVGMVLFVMSAGTRAPRSSVDVLPKSEVEKK